MVTGRLLWIIETSVDVSASGPSKNGYKGIHYIKVKSKAGHSSVFVLLPGLQFFQALPCLMASCILVHYLERGIN